MLKTIIQIFFATTALILISTAPAVSEETNKDGKADLFTSNLVIRAESTNLREQFASSAAGRLTLNDDIKKNSYVATAKIAVGYKFKGYLATGIDSDGSSVGSNKYTIIPYINYHSKLISNSNKGEINKLGGGVLLDFVIEGKQMDHAFSLDSNYLSDDRNEASILNGELSYYPIFDFNGPLAALSHYQVIGPLSIFVQPSLRYRYGHVSDEGNNIKLTQTNDYERAGGKVSTYMRLNPDTMPDMMAGYLKNVTFRMEYIWLYGLQGSLDRFERFEAGARIAFGENKNFGINLDYTNGHTNTTLQNIETLVGSFTVKY